jgi:beta-galactosidase
MLSKKYNDSWKYWVDKDSFALVWSVPDNAREVTLPHDAMIEKPANPDSLNGGNTGFRDGDIYTYVKIFHAPVEYRNITVMLKFEGVYMNTLVYVNGQLAAKNVFGYTTFYADLTDYLKYGEDNEIRVQVRAGAMTNSRWYSGAGIYRDVYLLESGLTYFVPEGICVKTENADSDLAVLSVSSEIKNRKHTPQNIILETTISDSEGNEVAHDKAKIVLFNNEERKITQQICVDNPKLWSEDTPVLYSCTSRIYEDGKGVAEDVLLDETHEIFGIRTITVDARRGLCINGKNVNLRGACIHHDSGLLGAATYDDAQYRQVKILKEAGFNAIRMSHHPAAPSLLRACDLLGVYVMDECFDMWTRCKSNYDYGLYFDEWWERDATAMVRKDYNHPSVILYSVGNEIPEIGTDYGAKRCYDIATKIKSIDNTRFTLASINGVFAAGDAVDKIVADVVSDLSKEGKIDGNVNDFMTLMDGHMDEIVVHSTISERLEKACAGIDVAGYNYMTARYEPDGIKYPNRVIVGSETYPPEIARNWDLVKRLPYLIGDFTWTGWDYIGEAGVGIPAYQWGEGGFGAGFPAQLAYCGDIDITGFRRPASYYREVVFGLRKEPYIAVQNPRKYGQFLIKTPWVISDAISSWTWGGCEGKPVMVEIYAPGDEVELLCNGKSLGRKTTGQEMGYRTLFDTVYEPGNLTAVVYEKGKEIGRTQIATANGERKLVLTKEEKCRNDELIYLQAVLCDNDGTVDTDNDVKLTLSVEGGADVVGFGSGNPKPSYNFNEGVTESFNGRAQIILKRNNNTDNNHDCITVKVASDNGISAKIIISD